MSRTGLHIALFAAYTVLSVAGIVLLRRHLPPLVDAWQGRDAWAPLLWAPLAGAVMYATSFLLWLAILATTPASRAYPIAVGLTLVGVTVAAAAVLGERVTGLQLVGIAAIFGGIVLVSTVGGAS